MALLPGLMLNHGFDICSVNIKTMRKFVQIFVAFSDSTKKGLGFPVLSTEIEINRYSFENYKLLDQPFCDMMVTISFFLNPNSSSSFRSKSKME